VLLGGYAVGCWCICDCRHVELCTQGLAGLVVASPALLLVLPSEHLKRTEVGAPQRRSRHMVGVCAGGVNLLEGHGWWESALGRGSVAKGLVWCAHP
jgi:hypothetical protein